MLTAMVVLAAVTCTPPKPAPARTIQGVFVEMNGEHDWYRALRSPKVREIIIANVKGYDDDSCTRPDGCDKTSEALDLLEAVPKGKDVYVGLVYDAHFSVGNLGGARKEDYDVAAAFWKAARARKLEGRITGWYLAREWHNFKGDTQDLETYLAGISNDLTTSKEFPARPLAAAPFFVPCADFASSTETAAMFARLVRGTAIKLLLLQDGFAERMTRECTASLPLATYAAAAKSYATDIATAMKTAKVRFAVDLEGFGALTRNQCRLDWQFKSLPSKDTPVFVYDQRDCLVNKLCQ